MVECLFSTLASGASASIFRETPPIPTHHLGRGRQLTHTCLDSF